jgi:hypothetical protein
VKNEGVDGLTDSWCVLLVLLKLKTGFDIIKPDEDVFSDSRQLKVHLQAFFEVPLHLQEVHAYFEHRGALSIMPRMLNLLWI